MSGYDGSRDPAAGAPEGAVPPEPDARDQAVEPSPPPEAPLTLRWRNTEAALTQAAEAVDIHKKLGNRRAFHLVALFVILWMFVPDLGKDEYKTGVFSWLIILAAVAMMVYEAVSPGLNNRRFARNKAAAAPECVFVLTARGFELSEGEYRGYTDFAEELKCAALEYEGVIALSYDKNRVSAVPRDQLEDGELDRLRWLLRQGLGDRFEKVEKKNGRRRK